MFGSWVIFEGVLVESARASFALDDLDVCYGYGCYETLKVREGSLWFPERHAERLVGSAAVLGIPHSFDSGTLVRGLEGLVAANGVPDCNLRVLLIGREGRGADWYAFAQPAIVPPEGSSTDGVACLLFHGERHFPKAKSLSMLLSTIAFRRAKARGCWDALLVNRREELTEGTRTNLFYAESGEGGAIFTPPSADVLAGVTRATLMEALAEAGLPVAERPLELAEALAGRFGLIVTSTSSRLLPVRTLIQSPDDGSPGGSIERTVVLPIPKSAVRMQAIYSDWLERNAPSRP